MEADRRLIERSLTQHRLVTRSDLAIVGMSDGQWRRRLEQGEWLEVAPEVWTHLATQLTWEILVRAGLLWLGPRSVLSGEAAARWWELEGFDSDRVEFLTPRVRRSKHPRFELHTTSIWDAVDLSRHRGVPCTSATRAILDLAGRPGMSPRRLERAIDSAIRLRRTALPQLRMRMAHPQLGRRRGITLVRELLLDSGGESHLERRFLALVRRHGLPRPTCQVVHRSNSTSPMRVDFQFPGTNLIVEVSGRLGHVSDRDRQRDARRRNALQLNGFEVVEFTTADVIGDPEYVITLLRAALTSRLVLDPS